MESDCSSDTADALLAKMEKRRIRLINAVARRYYILLDSELLDALVITKRNPIKAVGEAIDRMRPDEIVLNLGHFEDRRLASSGRNQHD